MPPIVLDEGRVARWAGELAEGDWWVAEYDGVVAGLVGVCPSRDPLDPPLGELDTIAVDPPYWRTGIGTALMHKALDELAAGYPEPSSGPWPTTTAANASTHRPAGTPTATPATTATRCRTGSPSLGATHRVVGMTSVREDLAPSGVLRASINLGNPVLAQGTPEEPAGVTVDIARELARRLEVPVELVCFDAARKSFEAMTTGQADICFLAIDPARAGEVAFTAPYVVIEGVYAVPADSPLTTVDEVDSPGVRIGVKQGSAYDLYLTRTLQQATVVRGDEGVDIFLRRGAGGGRRDPAADRAVRCREPRCPADRRTIHGDPAGRRHHEDAPSRDRCLPPRCGRGAQGQRFRRRRPGPFRPAGRLGRATPPDARLPYPLR